jgi:hypothetical protein
MAKIKGNNVRLYIGGDLLAHTNEVSINFETGTEEVTDAESGNWVENLPTLNSWSIDTTAWYNNAVASGADFSDVMDAYLNQTELTLMCELETGVDYSGFGYLTSLSPSGGTAGAYVQFTAGFIGTGEVS